MKPQTRHTFGLLALLALSAATVNPSHCGSKDPNSRTLSILLASELRQTALPAVVCDWFSESDWAVRFDRSPATPKNPVATARIYRSYANVIEISFDYSGDGSRQIRRVLPLSEGLNESGLELVVQSLHSLVQLEDRMDTLSPLVDRPAVQPNHTPSLRTPGGDSSKPTANNSHALLGHIQLGYGGTRRGAESASYGPQLVLGVGWQVRSLQILGILRAGSWRAAPMQIESLQLLTAGWAFATGMLIRRRAGPVFLEANGNFAVDSVKTSIRILEPDSEVGTLRPEQSPTTSYRPFLGAALGVSLPWRNFEISLSAQLRWQLVDSPYQIQELDPELQTSPLIPDRLQAGSSLAVRYLWQ